MFGNKDKVFETSYEVVNALVNTAVDRVIENRLNDLAPVETAHMAAALHEAGIITMDEARKMIGLDALGVNV